MFADRDQAGNGHVHLSGPVSAAWGMSGFLAWTLQRDRLPVVYVRSSDNYPDSVGLRLDRLDLLGAPCIAASDSRSIRYLLGKAAKEHRAEVQNRIDEVIRDQAEPSAVSTRLVSFIGTPAQAVDVDRLHHQLALPGTVETSPIDAERVRITLQVANPYQIQMFVAAGVAPELQPETQARLEAEAEQRLTATGIDPASSEGRQALRILLEVGSLNEAIREAESRPPHEHGLSQRTLLDLVGERFPQAVSDLRTQLAGERATPRWWSSPFVLIEADPADSDRLAVLLEDLLLGAQRRHAEASTATPGVVILEGGLVQGAQATSELDHLLRLGRRFGLHVVVIDDGKAPSPVTSNCATRVTDRPVAKDDAGMVVLTSGGASVPWVTVSAIGLSRPLSPDELHADLLARGRQAVATGTLSPSLWSAHA